MRTERYRGYVIKYRTGQHAKVGIYLNGKFVTARYDISADKAFERARRSIDNMLDLPGEEE